MTENSSLALLALNDFDEFVKYFQKARHTQYMAWPDHSMFV
jgi:hypothetical protein